MGREKGVGLRELEEGVNMIKIHFMKSVTKELLETRGE